MYRLRVFSCGWWRIVRFGRKWLRGVFEAFLVYRCGNHIVCRLRFIIFYILLLVFCKFRPFFGSCLLGKPFSFGFCTFLFGLLRVLFLHISLLLYNYNYYVLICLIFDFTLQIDCNMLMMSVKYPRWKTGRAILM